MISLLSSRTLPLVAAAALWLSPSLPAHSQEPAAPGTPQPPTSGTPASPAVNPPYETRPLQAAAVCPEKSKSVLQADKAYDEFRWFRGSFATTLEDKMLLLRGIEMTEWRNCLEIEVGPGDWYVVMSKAVPQGEKKVPDAIVPFKVTAHKKPDFTVAGVPADQVRPRSEVVLTITPASGTEYKSYRLYELDSEFQMVGTSAESAPAGTASAAPDGTGKAKPKGEACIKFEARKNVKPPPSDPAAVIAYLGNRSRQAGEKVKELGAAVSKLDIEIPPLQEEVRTKEAELAAILQPTEEQKKPVETKKNLLAQKKKEREDALLEKARLEGETKFFEDYHKQAVELAKQIPDAEKALFDATNKLRNDSALPKEKQPVKNPGVGRLGVRERARLKRTVQESQERIASLYGGIAAFAAAEPGPPGPALVQAGSAPDTTIRVAPGTRTFYQVEITDANGCIASKQVEIDVRKFMVDLIVGTQFSTYNEGNDEPQGTPGGMMGGMNDAEDEKAFDQQVIVAGAWFRHAFSDYVEGYGEIGFGGLNIELANGRPAMDGNLAPQNVVRDAQVVEFELGARYALLEAWCTAEWIPKFFCNQLTGEQIKLEVNGRYGFSLLAEDEDELDLNGDLGDRDDFLAKWFFGFSIRNDNPGHILDESYIELGFGRSDNFLDNDGRFKANAMMLVDLGATAWDLFLEGRFDADGGAGSDDLRVTVGFQREMTSFLRTLFGLQNP